MTTTTGTTIATTRTTATTKTTRGVFKNEQELKPRKTRSRAGFFVSPAARLDKATARLKNVLSRVRVADLQKSKGDPKPSAKLAAMAAAAGGGWHETVADNQSLQKEINLD